jgi:ribosomal-protein-alanine N-acetyltransferase
MIKHYGTQLIKTERLVLKKGSLDDYLAVYEYDFMKLRDIDGEFEYQKQDQEQFKKSFEAGIEQFYADNEAARAFVWIIYLAENMAPIGEILTHSENAENKETEIAFNLHPDYWGKEYMPEAINAALEYLFDLGYENIKAVYSAGNKKSKRVLEKTGFKSCGVEKNAWIKNGKPVDEYITVMTKSDWDRMQRI